VIVAFMIDVFAFAAVNAALTVVWVLDGSGTWKIGRASCRERV